MELSQIEQKAIRLVMERRVYLRHIADDRQSASGTVDGDTDTYQASFDPSGRICTCPAGANHRRCSHGLALELEAARIVDGATV